MSPQYVPSTHSLSADASLPDAVTPLFTPENICGEGATCTVYRLHLNGFRVAVKRLKSPLLGNPVSRAAYRKEFHIGQSLKHELLPVYRQLSDRPDELYIVMEYADGPTLAKFLSSDEGIRFFSDPVSTADFFRDILNVVNYLHQSGVIHCDIKPENIIMRPGYRRPMLIDLDKAYSDSLHLTHGGTPGISDPLTGSTPTTRKDIDAIIALAQFIASSIPSFPRRQLRRFLRESGNPDASISSLSSSLSPKPRNITSFLIPALAIIALLVATAILFIRNSSTSPLPLSDTIPSPLPSSDNLNSPSVLNSSPDNPNASPDNPISSEIHNPDNHPSIIPAETPSVAIPAAQPAASPLQNFSTSVPINIPVDDISTRFRPLSRRITEAIDMIREGSASTDSLREIHLEIANDYVKVWDAAADFYKNQFPEATSIDIQIDLARALERSSFTPLFTRYNQLLLETLRLREKW